jgi:hypothetical protein
LGHCEAHRLDLLGGAVIDLEQLQILPTPTEVSEKIRLLTFMVYDLGCFDHQTGLVECAEYPFAAP